MGLYKVTFERHVMVKQRAEVVLHADGPDDAQRIARAQTQRPATMANISWHNGEPEITSHEVLGVAPIVQRDPPKLIPVAEDAAESVADSA